MKDKKTDLCDLAEKFIFSGDYASALKKALRAHKTEETKERGGKLLVWIYRMMGKPAKALFYLKQMPLDSDVFCEQAILYRMLCDFKMARKKISAALRIYVSKKDKEGVAFAYWTRGGIERYGGNPKKGFCYFKKALPLTRDPSARGYVLCGIGGTARLLGDYALSAKCYLSSNKIFSRRKEKFGIAMQKDFKKSDKLYKKAVAIYEKIKDRWNMAYSMWGQAQTDWFLGRKKQALQINRVCVKIFKEFSDPRGVFYCYMQEANFLRMESEFKKAASVLARSASVPDELSLAYEKGLLREQLKLIKQKNSQHLLIA